MVENKLEVVKGLGMRGKCDWQGRQEGILWELPWVWIWMMVTQICTCGEIHRAIHPKEKRV